MPYPFYTVPTFVTDDWLTPSLLNTYWGGNMVALWRYNAAGQIVYSISANELAALAAPTKGILLHNGTAPLWLTFGASDAKKVLQVNSDGSAAQLAHVATKAASKLDTTGHSYNSATWRDMPNSSGTIVLEATSKIQVTATVINYAPTQTYGWRNFQVRINGIDVGIIAKESYQIGETVTTTWVGSLSGVAAGSRTILIREQAEIGDYVVAQLAWEAIAIPE